MKVAYGKSPIIYPIPIILAGANVDGKPNFEILGQVGLMGISPPIVYISSGIDHYTNTGILENNTYSINFPTTNMLAVTDYCGIVSGRDVDKSKLFEVFYGELKTTPMIKACPVTMECKVIKEFSFLHRQIFMGEVIMTYIDDEYLQEVNGRKVVTEMGNLDPIIYALDNRYYRIGEAIGTGYQEGQNLSKSD